MTHPILRLLMEADDKTFSASNTDMYHVSTGQAMQGMQGSYTLGNMVLRGGLTSTYTVIFGLRHILEALANFRFDGEFIEWALGAKNPDGSAKYNPEYIRGLKGRPFEVKIAMMPDGSIAFPGPIGRIWSETDPLQAKWVDSIISDFLRRGSSVATKAARLYHMQQKYGFVLADNSLRRSNDIGGMLTAEAVCMTGMGTSNMRAAMLNGFTPVGTMDHWYVMVKMAEFFSLHPTLSTRSIENQREAQRYAFRCFLHEFPVYGMLLVDTLSVEIGVEDAIIVLKEFPSAQHYSLRIDSGDLEKGSRWATRRLQEEGLSHIAISPTGGLRAVNLDALGRKGVPMRYSGIGEYFQFGGERQRKPEDLSEALVNTEIVTKVGYFKATNGSEFRLSKLSAIAAKASRGGILDRVRLTKDGRLVADIEVDLLRGRYFEKALDRNITSLRLDTWETRTFRSADGYTVERPIERLLDGPDFVGAEDLTAKAAAARFQRQFKMLDDGLKEVDGSHNGAPAGVEALHYQGCLEMAQAKLIVDRV